MWDKTTAKRLKTCWVQLLIDFLPAYLNVGFFHLSILTSVGTNPKFAITSPFLSMTAGEVLLHQANSGS